jgi:hypothetical protein
MKEAMGAMKEAIDKYVLNFLVDAGTGSFSTPTGGFTGGNMLEIAGKVHQAVAGYSTSQRKPYVVMEATDVSGFFMGGAANGFAAADRWLNNGIISDWAGIDWYVVPSGTFVSATLGTTAFTNAGLRLAGIPGIATVLMPGGQMDWMEKEVPGKTGAELAMAAYCGVKAWYQKLAWTIAITLA